MAFEREKRLVEEKKQLEEEISRINRKREVQAQESDYAHSKAQHYREEKEIDKQLDAQIKALQGIQNGVSSSNNNPSAASTNTKDLKNIDYT